MAHNLDITAGVASFVSAREDAWHQLGITLDHSFTAEEAMTEANLGGWNVRKQELWTAGSDGSPIIIPNRNAIVRNNPVVAGQVDALGVVGDAYQEIQNEEHAGFLDALVDESGAHFETAGALDGGRRVFITMKLPGHMTIGGTDKIDTYIAAINSHDGSMAFTVMTTPVRIVCANTLNLAFSGASNMHRVRHTAGATASIVQARQTLELSFGYLEGFQAEADRMINTELTQVRFEEIIAKEFGAAADAPKGTVTRSENRLDEMVELFAEANTQAGIRNTAWAGLNAITEWFDHYSPVRGSEEDTSRATKALLTPAFKNRARELMLAV